MAYRILVVEDDLGLRAVYEQMLQFAGYEVSGVGSGDEALVILEKNPPHLMTLDINLPGISGLALLRHARQRLGLAEMKIAMLTANIIAANSDYSDLVDITLEKPISNDYLLRVCRQLLDGVEIG